MRVRNLESWMSSVIDRLPLHSLPSDEQCKLAKELTSQPENSWCKYTYMTVYALLNAQCAKKGIKTDSKLAHELMALMTWNLEVVCPHPLSIPESLDQINAPKHILRGLATLQTQTHYLQIQRYLDKANLAFLAGAWMMFDVHRDTNQKSILVLFDAVVNGAPNREILCEFTVEDDYEVAIQRFLDDLAFTLNWPADEEHAKRANDERNLLRMAIAVLNLFHEALITNASTLSTARAMAQPEGQSGIKFCDLSFASWGESKDSMHVQ